MTKFFSRLSLIVIAAASMICGCSSPVPHPIVQPPPTRDGIELNRTATTIAPDPSGLPYIILNEDWVIPEGQTVTIMPGTEIMVAGKYWIDVSGKLIAHGTAQQPIIFTSAFTDVDLGQWRGLKLHNPVESSELSHCIFTWGAFYDTDTLTERGIDAQNYRGMLAVRNSSPIIEHCVAMFNQNNGVFITGGNSDPTIRYNIFTENDASGIRGDTTVNLGLFAGQIAYNCVADNSAPGFIMGFDSTEYGFYSRVNENVDSCDAYYNIDLPPLLNDPANGDFSLQSCSPCVDAGPSGADPDPDGTRADMGSVPYTQAAAELRGRISGTLAATTYRVTCDLVVAPNEELIIPAGTRLEATGLYSIEVHGTLRVQGTPENRCVFCACQDPSGDDWGGIVFLNREFTPSVVEYVDIIGYDAVDVFKEGVQFRGVRFENGFQYGVSVNTGTLNLADSVSFLQCEFSNSGEAGVIANGSAVTVRQSFVHGTRGRGIQLAYVGESAIVTNTVVTACSTSGIVLEYFSDATIINNVFDNCGYHGIHLNENCQPLILNNIISNNGYYGILAENSSTPEVDYNNVFEHLENYKGSEASVLTPGSGSLSANPLFAGAGDYHLAGGSPCIDAGHPDGQYNDTNGSRNDMGAFGGPGGGSVGVSSRPIHTVATR